MIKCQSFTWGKCDCGENIKIDVGQDIKSIKCPICDKPKATKKTTPKQTTLKEKVTKLTKAE